MDSLSIIINYDAFYKIINDGVYFLNVFEDINEINGNHNFTIQKSYSFTKNAIRFFENKGEYLKAGVIHSQIKFFLTGNIDENDTLFNLNLIENEYYVLPQSKEEVVQDYLYNFVGEDNFIETKREIMSTSLEVVTSKLFVSHGLGLINFLCLAVEDEDISHNYIKMFFEEKKIFSNEAIAYDIIKTSLISLYKNVNIEL